MPLFENIDPEAVRLLEEADWHWSECHNSFEQGRDPDKETTEEYLNHPPDRISYEELRDHGLAGQALTADREAGFQWLRRKL
jgi:hypothetical protein